MNLAGPPFRAGGSGAKWEAMRTAIALFLAAAGAVLAVWWWLGRPVHMPPSPLAQGEKLECVSYAPFRNGQTPLDLSTRIPADQIEADMEKLAGLTKCVRTYSTDLGLDQIAEIAGRHGLQVLQGVWLGSNPVRNRAEIETAVRIANKFPTVVRGLVVGNEVLLRGELSSGDLANLIRSVKAKVSVPVTYADVWEFWLRHRDLASAVDFITIHILPYWEDEPVAADAAAAHVQAIRQKVATVFPNRDILIGEVGWPSLGRMREGALPSPVNQARVFHDVLALAKREDYRVNLIEAFDQPWKRQLEGTVGGHWGLLDAETRGLKFGWGEPLSNHPRWRAQAAGGVLLVAAVFAAAFFAGRRAKAEVGLDCWIAVAIISGTAGAMIGLAVERAAVESLGAGLWIRSAALVFVALSAPILAAAAIAARETLPDLAGILGRRAGWRAVPLALGLVWAATIVLAIQVALGLVFDPRYRDFTFAPLTAAAVAFAAVVFIVPRMSGPRGAAEKTSAAVLAGSSVYIALSESMANWQALWLCAVLLLLSLVLLRARAAPDLK